MRRCLLLAFLFILCASFVSAQCANDHRSDKNGGVLVSDFSITGTTTLTSTELSQITSSFVGNCYQNTEEMDELLRVAFQDHGYFTVEVKSVNSKPGDPLGTPKPVTVEADVAEGPLYKTAEITFLENHAFSNQKLRDAFPLKTGDVFTRGKVVQGLESMRAFYGSSGFLDSVFVPETDPSSNGTISLKVTVDEGKQYHMGKLETLGAKEPAARLHAAWTLAEGDPYDSTYIKKFVDENRDLLPPGFAPEDVHQIINCPDHVVGISLTTDPREAPASPAKTVPCDADHDKSK